MDNPIFSTLQEKETVVQASLRAFKPAQALDIVLLDANEALRNTLMIIHGFPGVDLINKYPLGRPQEDKIILAIKQHLCLCLSGNAPNGTTEMIQEHLLQALEIIQCKLEDSPF